MSYWSGQPINLDAVDATEPYDICVIGSGPAGTIVATSLAQKGLRTIVLESGTNMAQWLLDPKIHNLASYTFSGNTDYPLTKTKARLLGGNSNFWTGRCERLHPADFEQHAYTPQENPWPLTYSELDPYYHKAESTLRVRGGKRSEYAPPRNDAEHPLISPKTSITYLKNLFAKAGVKVDHSPTATPSKTFRFFNIQKEVLAESLNLPNLVVVTGVTVTKLLSNKDSEIISAQIKTFTNELKSVKAKRYMIACGGIESPRLLLLSDCEQFPNGIGNHSGMVGRGFNEHPAVNFYSRINHSLGTLKPTNKIGRTHQFYNNYRAEGLGSVLPVFRQAWLLPHHVMPFRLSNLPRQALNTAYRLIKPTLYMGVTIEQSIDKNNKVTLSNEKNDYFGNPIAHLNFSFTDEDIALLERCRQLCTETLKQVGATDIFESEVTWSRHHQGTCRMGNSPETSVVDRNLKVHECKNLYVGGCETFVTGGAMQPVLTTVALSHRLSDHLQGLFQADS